MNTHAEVSLRALRQMNFEGGDEKKKSLEKHMGYLHAGSAFPDWGYACGNSGAGETSHWPPFVQEFIKYIHEQGYSPSSEKY